MTNIKAYSKEWFQSAGEMSLCECLEIGGGLAARAHTEIKRRSEVAGKVSRGEIAIPVWGKPGLYMIKSNSGEWIPA